MKYRNFRECSNRKKKQKTKKQHKTTGVISSKKLQGGLKAFKNDVILRESLQVYNFDYVR